MPELEQKQFQKRNVACKVLISSILDGDFAKDDLSAGYVKLNGAIVSRVNVIANLVFKSEEDEYYNAIIDDGTAKISLKSFEKKALFSNIGVGDAVLVVGKIREYGNERYIMPEIIKKVDTAWMNLRKLELKEVIFSKKIETGSIVKSADAGNEIYGLIKKLDAGEGVPVEDLIGAYGRDAEKIANKLLENGDIFEIKPGRLKILE
jgi:RPA family protein